MAVADSRLAELDELIQESESEIESLRSREQSAPLQKGCSFFGLFTMVIFIIALFMILGRGYVGRWPFFVCVGVVVLLSLFRIRRKQSGSAQLQELRRQRLDIEEGLAQLLVERNRIQRLKTTLNLEDQA